ncbi:hypothetical protein B0H14DRAFT_2611881 [Mycena olivaceomarginata]|nr:hypothetical protein B0H14DRAFT_2611881 [Mycena olivaceomarginata]
MCRLSFALPQALREHKNALGNVVHGQEKKNTYAVQKIKDVQTKIQSYISHIIWVMEGRLKVGFGNRAIMKICLKWRKLNMSQINSLLYSKEVEILAQEFYHAIQGFNKMETVWTALAHDHQEDQGKKAYALKKGNMYQEMGKDAQERNLQK